MTLFAKKQLFATTAAATVAMLMSGGHAYAGAVITHGATSLGVNDSAELNYSAPVLDEFGNPVVLPPVGVFRAGVGDAISPGCLCEGWGVATNYGGILTSGFANQSSGSGGLTGGVFGSTTDTATSVIGLAGAPIEITHAFGPSTEADIFQVNVTIKNTGDLTANNVVYRRVMDWDVPPTEFNEFVTHQGVEDNLASNGGTVRYASNNGFASSDPLTGYPNYLDFASENKDFIDLGPTDHGSLFDFALGNLASGASRTFSIFYGSREDEASALDALAALGVDLYSLGQNSEGTTGAYVPDPGPGGGEGGEGGGGVGDFTITAITDPGSDPVVPGPGATDGTPATFIFAFGGLGTNEEGEIEEFPILPPFVPAPGEFEFPAPQPRLWYDPPFAEGFTYELLGGGEFLEIIAPTIGFSGPFDIFVGGALVGSILPGESFFFDPADDPLVHVTEFDLRGISPTLDVADPGFAMAFPLFLDFSGDPLVLTLTMTAILAPSDVPEPATLLLLGAGLAGIVRLRMGQWRTVRAG